MTKRFRLYIFYGVLLVSLLALAATHFTMFVVSRRRFKKRTRDYITRKREFIALTMSQSQFQQDIEKATFTSTNAEPLNNCGDLIESEADTQNEEHEEAISARGTQGASDENSTRGRRRSVVIDALHEPVVVTVATVSAIFAEEMMREHSERGGRDWEQSRRRSSGISDIIDSPRRRVPQHYSQ